MPFYDPGNGNLVKCHTTNVQTCFMTNYTSKNEMKTCWLLTFSASFFVFCVPCIHGLKKASIEDIHVWPTEQWGLLITFWLICFMQSALPRKLYLLDTGREIHISVLYQAFTLTILYILSSSATSRLLIVCKISTNIAISIGVCLTIWTQTCPLTFLHNVLSTIISGIIINIILLSIFANKCLYMCIHISTYHSANIELAMKATDQSPQE